MFLTKFLEFETTKESSILSQISQTGFDFQTFLTESQPAIITTIYSIQHQFVDTCLSLFQYSMPLLNQTKTLIHEILRYSSHILNTNLDIILTYFKNSIALMIFDTVLCFLTLIRITIFVSALIMRYNASPKVSLKSKFKVATVVIALYLSTMCVPIKFILYYQLKLWQSLESYTIIPLCSIERRNIYIIALIVAQFAFKSMILHFSDIFYKTNKPITKFIVLVFCSLIYGFDQLNIVKETVFNIITTIKLFNNTFLAFAGLLIVISLISKNIRKFILTIILLSIVETTAIFSVLLSMRHIFCIERTLQIFDTIFTIPKFRMPSISTIIDFIMLIPHFLLDLLSTFQIHFKSIISACLDLNISNESQMKVLIGFILITSFFSRKFRQYFCKFILLTITYTIVFVSTLVFLKETSITSDGIKQLFYLTISLAAEKIGILSSILRQFLEANPNFTIPLYTAGFFLLAILYFLVKKVIQKALKCGRYFINSIQLLKVFAMKLVTITLYRIKCVFKFILECAICFSPIFLIALIAFHFKHDIITLLSSVMQSFHLESNADHVIHYSFLAFVSLVASFIFVYSTAIFIECVLQQSKV